VRALALDLIQSRDPRKEIGLDAWGWLLETRYGHPLAATVLKQQYGARELTLDWFKGRLFSPSRQAAEFAQKLLPEVHPTEKLGPGFFGELLDAISDPNTESARNVSTFALAELARFDLNQLDGGLLQRLLLNPLTRGSAIALVNEGRLKAQTYPLDFLKALAFPAAWASDPRTSELRRSERGWARDLDFSEELDEQVLAVAGPLFDGLYEFRRRAMLLGRDYVIPDDVKALAGAALAHRLIMSPEARMRSATPSARTGMTRRAKKPKLTAGLMCAPEISANA